jgi:hypothetical protein
MEPAVAAATAPGERTFFGEHEDTSTGVAVVSPAELNQLVAQVLGLGVTFEGYVAFEKEALTACTTTD